MLERSYLYSNSEKIVTPRATAVLLSLIIMTAFILRVYRLGLVSFRFDPEEAGYSLLAMRILDSPETSLELWSSTAWRGLGHINFSPVYAWNVVWFFCLFSPSLATLNLVPVFYGLIAVGLTFGIINLLFSPRLAMLSAFFLAVSPNS